MPFLDSLGLDLDKERLKKGLMSTLAGGGVLGGLSQLFTNDSEEDRRKGNIDDRNAKLLALLGQYNDRAQEATPGTSAFFRSGQAQLNTQAQRQAENDASAATRRGAAGSEFEIAQAANRNRFVGQGTTRLLGQADAIQNRERQQAIARLLQGYGLANQSDIAFLQDERQQSNAYNQQLAGNVSTALSVFGPKPVA